MTVYKMFGRRLNIFVVGYESTLETNGISGTWCSSLRPVPKASHAVDMEMQHCPLRLCDAHIQRVDVPTAFVCIWSAV